jgi:DNA adenine methylase
MISTNTIESEIIHDSFFIINNYTKPHDFVKSPFRYPGGKYYALKQIIPFLDCLPHDEFREPFVGGGSIFFAKRKVKFNWINDLESDIINVYKAFSDSTYVQELEKLWINEIATPERHFEVKNYSPKNFIEQAFKTYYLNRTSYCGIIHKPAWGYKDGKSSPPQNWHNFILQASAKLQHVKITSLDFEEIIKTSPVGKRVLMYLDPPYYNADQKRAYTKPFEENDHIRLCKILKNTDFYFCLSYDDCEEVRNLYSWAHIYEKKWLYNTANKKGESRALGNELIITNYEVRSNDLFTNILLKDIH